MRDVNVTLFVSLLVVLGCFSDPGATKDLGVSGETAGTGAGTNGAGTSGSAGAAGVTGVIPDNDGNADSGGVPDPSRDGGAQVDSDAMVVADAGDLKPTGPGDWVAGDYPPNITSATYLEISGVTGQGDKVRQYKVHVPPSYKPDVPMPAVFCIHGLYQDPLLFCLNGAAMDKKSDSAGFILIMPNGYQNSWNAGTCCGAASTEKLDDVALFRAILSEVGTHVNIDRKRVYATGLSNGGYMSYRLACEAADIFTAVAPGAGAVGINDIGGGTNAASDFVECKPSQPVSVLDIHGTADNLVAYSLQAPSTSLMSMRNGCSSTTTPATDPPSGGDTTCVTYSGCPSDIELTACSIKGGGHCWFASPDCGTGAGAIGMAFVGTNSDTMKNTDEVWDFFKRHSR